ncbi:hypothetical protein SCLCIDRAFT_1223407, partial [Scleroderma citrinum Foug A]
MAAILRIPRTHHEGRRTVQIFRELLETYQNHGVPLFIKYLRPEVHTIFDGAGTVATL